MPERYKVLVSPKANRMLVDHAAFLAHVNEKAALELLSKFKETTKSLSSFPERCPYFNDEMLPKHKYRKLLFSRRYLLIYQVIGDTVYIDYVLDCRQEYNWLL